MNNFPDNQIYYDTNTDPVDEPRDILLLSCIKREINEEMECASWVDILSKYGDYKLGNLFSLYIGDLNFAIDDRPTIQEPVRKLRTIYGCIIQFKLNNYLNHNPSIKSNEDRTTMRAIVLQECLGVVKSRLTEVLLRERYETRYLENVLTTPSDFFKTEMNHKLNNSSYEN